MAAETAKRGAFNATKYQGPNETQKLLTAVIMSSRPQTVEISRLSIFISFVLCLDY